MRVSSIVIALLVLVSAPALAEQPVERPECQITTEDFANAKVDPSVKPEDVRKRFNLKLDNAAPVGGTWLLQCPEVQTQCPQSYCSPVPGCSSLFDTGAEGCEQTACPTGQTIHILECGCDAPNRPCLARLSWACM